MTSDIVAFAGEGSSTMPFAPQGPAQPDDSAEVGAQ